MKSLCHDMKYDLIKPFILLLALGFSVFLSLAFSSFTATDCVAHLKLCMCKTVAVVYSVCVDSRTGLFFSQIQDIIAIRGFSA